MIHKIIILLAFATLALTASPCNATHPYVLSGVCYIRIL